MLQKLAMKGALNSDLSVSDALRGLKAGIALHQANDGF
jgi:hypothetical protein